MNWIRRIIISFSITFLAMCCGAVMLFSWPKTGWKALSVPTGSMRPSIQPGSLVFVHRVPNSSLKVGDVITYTNLEKPNTTITHRIINTYELDGKIPTFVTKGDANAVPDASVVGGLVKGKVVWHIPYLGTILIWFKQPLVLLPFTYLLAIAVAIKELQRLNEYYRKIQVYRLAGFERVKKRFNWKEKVVMGGKLTTALIVASMFILQPIVQAALTTNTVALIGNSLSIATTPPPNNCSGNTTNNTNIHIVNNNPQTATSGSTNVSNNTNGGSATSGNAGNSSNTSFNISVTNSSC